MGKKDEEEKGGIIIKIKQNPEVRTRERTKKFARSYVRLAVSNLALSFLIFVVMALWKNDIQRYVTERGDLTGMNTFYNLEDWIQWTIICGLNVWAVFEVMLTLALKHFVRNESVKMLKIWLIIDLIDCILAGILIIVIVYYVTLLTKVILGIFVLIAFLYEIYFVRTLLQFIRIISHSSAYEQEAFA